MNMSNFAFRYQAVRSSEQIEANTMFGGIGSEPATAASLRKSRRTAEETVFVVPVVRIGRCSHLRWPQLLNRLPRPRSWDYGARTFCR
jgi:hypothetical protein